MSDTTPSNSPGKDPVIVGISDESQKSPPAQEPTPPQPQTGPEPKPEPPPVQPPQPSPPSPSPSSPPPSSPQPPQQPPSPQDQPQEEKTPPKIDEPTVVLPKKTKSLKGPGLVLGVLLMIVTLPAALILLQKRTAFVPRAKVEKPMAWILYRENETYSPQEKKLFPQNLNIQNPSNTQVKISFETQIPVRSKLGFSPDSDWNYLLMEEEGVEYNPENEKWSSLPKSTDHEFVLKDLTPGGKYYFIISVYNESSGYEFGYDEPDHAFSFTAGEEQE